MEIRNLSQTKIETIVECLVESFKNYFVKMPSNVDFWRNRFHAARVDYTLSFGVFDQDKLVAFIIHGIDMHNHQKTAFNTGTGVIEAYRGQKLVDQMYSFAFPILKENDIEKCMLEVIDKNDRAISVYERIGFKKDRFLICFNGKLKDVKSSATIEKVNILKHENLIMPYQAFYSWDHSIDAIRNSPNFFTSYLVKTKLEDLIGYFIVNRQNKALIQMEAFDQDKWMDMIGSIQSIVPTFKMNNIDSGREYLIDSMKQAGMENYINQFEMSLLLNNIS